MREGAHRGVPHNRAPQTERGQHAFPSLNRSCLCHRAGMLRCLWTARAPPGSIVRRLGAAVSRSGNDTAVLRGTSVVADTLACLARARDAGLAQPQQDSGWHMEAVLVGPGNRASQLVAEHDGGALPTEQVLACALGRGQASLPPAPRGATAIGYGSGAVAQVARLCGLGGGATLPADDVAVVLRRPHVDMQACSRTGGLAGTWVVGTAVKAMLDEAETTGGPLLLLDGVSDPGNLGALARTAAFLGAAGTVSDAKCASPYGSKAIAASRGASLCIPWAVAPSMAEALTSLGSEAARAGGLTILVAEADGGARCDDIRPGDIRVWDWGSAAEAIPRGDRETRIPRQGVVALLLGSEGSGIAPETRMALAELQKMGACVRGVSVAGSTLGEAPWASAPGACLNVGAAGAVLLHWITATRP